jgi:hypothetical protein
MADGQQADLSLDTHRETVSELNECVNVSYQWVQLDILCHQTTASHSVPFLIVQKPLPLVQHELLRRTVPNRQSFVQSINIHLRKEPIKVIWSKTRPILSTVARQHGNPEDTPAQSGNTQRARSTPVQQASTVLETSDGTTKLIVLAKLLRNAVQNFENLLSPECYLHRAIDLALYSQNEIGD